MDLGQKLAELKLRRFAGVSEAGARSRNPDPERSEVEGTQAQ
jgi:hypothetical protein